MLRTEHLTVRFGGLTAVNDVSLSIDPTELTGIIGPNGAGKTTLFNLVTGFITPTSGKVYFNDTCISSMSPHKITTLGLTRTFQITKPFEQMSLLDNVVVGSLWHVRDMREARSIARSALQKVGLAHLAQRQATGLPVGYRKRLEVARVLATKPKMVLLDEVMGGLTPQEINEMGVVISEIKASGIAVVMIEHVMSAVMSLCQRLYVFNQGMLIASGPPSEIRNNDNVIEAYLGKKFRKKDKTEQGGQA